MILEFICNTQREQTSTKAAAVPRRRAVASLVSDGALYRIMPRLEGKWQSDSG